jgi:putative membrane protein
VRSREPVALLVAVVVALAISAIRPRELGTWALESAPVVIAIPILVATWRAFPLTPLAYRLISIHAVILLVGAHYTYAHVPLGFWLQDAFDLARNPYDRIGHFAQGFVPAIVAREILLRVTQLGDATRRGPSPSSAGKMLFFLVLCVALAISAFYELIEWWTAVIFGAGANEFLGTQGDPWDTQWDMFLALVGAATAQLLLARMHDRQIAALGVTEPWQALGATTPAASQPPLLEKERMEPSPPP